MSVMIYMTVTVDGDKVTPQVHVSSFQQMGMAGQSGILQDIPLEEVRHGLEVTGRVLGFAEGLRQG